MEDRADDETRQSLRLVEECQAAAGEFSENFSGCSLTHAKAFDPDDEAAPQSKDESGAKAKRQTPR